MANLLTMDACEGLTFAQCLEVDVDRGAAKGNETVCKIALATVTLASIPQKVLTEAVVGAADRLGRAVSEAEGASEICYP